MTSLTKNLKPTTKKFFFIANYKTYQVFWTFEQLSITYSPRVMPTQSHVRTSCFHGNR